MDSSLPDAIAPIVDVMDCRAIGALAGLCLATCSFASEPASPASIKELRLGEAFFYEDQGRYFDALTRLQAVFGSFYGPNESNIDRLKFPAAYPGKSVRDIEFAYRMVQRTERTLRPDANIEQSVRNDLATRLAKIYLQRHEPDKAWPLVESLPGDAWPLRAETLLAMGRSGDAATLLLAVEKTGKLDALGAYNLGIALMQAGQMQEGLEQLDKLGRMSTGDEASLAVRDKANLVLGYRLLGADQPESAKRYFDRVQLSGIYSNRALLGSGWADVNRGDYERSLVPWSELVKRNITDTAVQEAMLGVPYAYAKLGLHGKAASLYGRALEAFDAELDKLDTSIKIVREGKFLRALARDELRDSIDWLVGMRRGRDAPETLYLLEMMASNDFQEAMKNFRDLDEMQRRLMTWSENLAAFQEVLDARRKYFRPILPAIDRRIQGLSTRITEAHAQRRALDTLVDSMWATPRTDLLETPEERRIREMLRNESRIFESLHKNDFSQQAEQIRIRIRRLDGMIQWPIFASYDQRLARSHAQLVQLDHDDDAMAELHDSVLAYRQAATQGYSGLGDRVKQLVPRVREQLAKVKALIARQGHAIEEMAINELGVRRKQLEEYQVQAIFAQGQSYEAARKAQMKERGSR